jgi:hypothetical protein
MRPPRSKSPVVPQSSRRGSVASCPRTIALSSIHKTTRTSDPPDDVYVLSVTDEVRLNLNCAGGYATATNPGASVASPAGREARAAADEAAAAEEQELAEVSTPDE